jgi:hypothetical protein
MPQAMRGLRWRVATAVVGVIVFVLWKVSGVDTPVIQIEWGGVPDLAGAEVVVDGEAVGRLELRSRRPRTGFKVAKGLHEVALRWGRCPGQADTITAVSGRPAFLVADVEDRYVDGQVRCAVVLRR